MDETKRTIIGSTGGVLMVGGIGWAASWYFATGKPSVWRLMPALAMLVLGSALLLWGIKQPNPKRLVLGLLDDAIQEAQIISDHGASDFEFRWRQWSMNTYSMLQRGFGEAVAARFRKNAFQPGPTGFPTLMREQVEELERIRYELAAGTIALRR